jgi:hypothetical protein
MRLELLFEENICFGLGFYPFLQDYGILAVTGYDEDGGSYALP